MNALPALRITPSTLATYREPPAAHTYAAAIATRAVERIGNRYHASDLDNLRNETAEAATTEYTVAYAQYKTAFDACTGDLDDKHKAGYAATFGGAKDRRWDLHEEVYAAVERVMGEV